MIEADHQAVTAPKLNVVPVDKAALCSLDCFGIICANQRLASYEVPVAPDGKCPILCSPPADVLEIPIRSLIYCGVCPVPDSEISLNLEVFCLWNASFG